MCQARSIRRVPWEKASFSAAACYKHKYLMFLNIITINACFVLLTKIFLTIKRHQLTYLSTPCVAFRGWFDFVRSKSSYFSTMYLLYPYSLVQFY